MHVCASAYLSMRYWLPCISSLQVSQLELVVDAFPKTSSFKDCGREYSGEYVSRSAITYVRSPRTSVFWCASPGIVLREAC